MTFYSKLCAVIICILLQMNSYAEVTFSSNPQKQECISDIFIKGEINAETTKQIQTTIEKNFNHPKCLGTGLRSVFLDSNGGSVEEAIKIGYLLRENEFMIFVRAPDKCFSSCVLLLASGNHRMAFGKVGIHRPYFEYLSTNKSVEEIKKIKALMMERLTKYIDDMEVSKKLLDDMMAVEPENIRILSLSEMQDYRLIGYPISVDERNIAALAYMHGMSSMEYRNKNTLANNFCEKKYPWDEKIINEISENRRICNLSFLLNISESVAQKKLSVAIDACQKLPRYPIAKRQEFYDCKRSIFLSK